MRKISIFFIILAIITQLSTSQSTNKCNNYVFKQKSSNNNNNIPSTTFKTCIDLPVLNSFLHYNYYPTTSTLDIAYRHSGAGPGSSKWVSWALNPVSATSMVGCECLVAFHNPKDGSLVVYTSPITSYTPDLVKGDLSVFNVSNLKVSSSSDEIVIFATVKVPNNMTVLNQFWQDGPLSQDGKPAQHSSSRANLESMASLNILSGVVSTVDAANSGSRLKNVHGILNAISWGIMMPMGAITARYMKVSPSADPAWFYLHVVCQLAGYGLGVAGWATGLSLGAASEGIVRTMHRNIGIALFCLATIQITALLIRPKKEHKYRFYWRMYHHSFGYTIIILSIVNIFEGFKILEPQDIWKVTYIGVIIAMAVLAVVLEAFTWYVVFRRKKSEFDDGGHKLNQANNSV